MTRAVAAALLLALAAPAPAAAQRIGTYHALARDLACTDCVDLATEVTGTLPDAEMGSGTNGAMFTVDSDNTGGSEPGNGAGLKIEGGTGDCRIAWNAADNFFEIGCDPAGASTILLNQLLAPTISSASFNDASGPNTFSGEVDMSFATVDLPTDAVDAPELKSTAIQYGDIDFADLPDPVRTTRRLGYCVYNFSSATTGALCVGLSNPPATGTAAAAPAATGALRPLQSWTSAASSAAQAGSTYNAVSNALRRPMLPIYRAYLHTDTSTANRYVWVGLSNAAVATIDPFAATALDAIHFVAVAFSTATDSNWQCCSGDGTDASCVDIPSSTIAVDTDYRVTVDWSVDGTLTCRVEQVGGGTWTVDKTTLLSTSTTADFTPTAALSNTDAASHVFYLAAISLEATR